MNPFLDLLIEALNLTHPRFALAFGDSYAFDDTAKDKWRERPFLAEFFHQFRHLWERGLPGQLGLGHIVVQGEPNDRGPLPDFLFWQLGERGQPDRRLAAVSLTFHSDPLALSDDLDLLAHFKHKRGYPLAVNILIGRIADVVSVPQQGGVSFLYFDTEKWAARVVEGE